MTATLALLTTIALGAAPLMTEWGEKVTSENAWRAYPRPQMVRCGESNVTTILNGAWDYAITSVTNTPGRPTKWDGKILVPFALESALSGVGKLLEPDQFLWYTRKINCVKAPGERILLHFGAVDFRTMVFIGHNEVTDVPHEGGNMPFTLDITDYVTNGENELTVCVWDPTEDFVNSRGKQSFKPAGCFYTRVSGIWQTVWMERVPEQYIKGYKVVTDIDKGTVRLDFDLVGSGAVDVTVRETSARGRAENVAGAARASVTIDVPKAKLWSPEEPNLYHFKATYGKDVVSGYFGMRKFEKRKDANGVLRFFLNNKPYYVMATLDQGWWPDGLLTPPSDEAMAFDIQTLKDCGFNTMRKHIKVEPLRYYYLCDKMGLLVIQDLPSGNHSSKSPIETETTARYGLQRQEQKEMMDALQAVPSIVMWNPYNEGWTQPGEFLTHSMLDFTRRYDPTRLVNGPSGCWDWEGGHLLPKGWAWTNRVETAHRPTGVCEAADTVDMHLYRGPKMFPVNDRRISFLGEFGGLGHPVEGHLWKQAKGSWGYGGVKDTSTRAGLEKAYLGLMAKLGDLAEWGLAGSVYTQTTDVEIEINGLMTYDRKVLKFNPAVLRKAHAEVIRRATNPKRNELLYISHVHRGGGKKESPDNTLKTFRWCWENGSALECDCRRTKDGVGIMLHDDCLKRTARGISPDLATNSVSKSLTWAEIRDVDVGSYLGPQFADHRIPTIEETFAAMKGHPTYLCFVDEKGAGPEYIAKKAVEAGVQDQVYYTGPSHEKILQWRKVLPSGKAMIWLGAWPKNHGASERARADKWFRDAMAKLRAKAFEGIDVVSVHTYYDPTDPADPFVPSTPLLKEMVREFHAHGIRTASIPFQGGEREETYFKLHELGFDGFSTDYPSVMFKVIKILGARTGESSAAGGATVAVPSDFGTNGTFTVGCWIKNDSYVGYPDDYSLLYRGNSIGFRRVQFDLRLFGGRPEFFYSSGYGNLLGLRHAGSDWLANDGHRVPAKDLPKVPRGAWCHVAAVSSADGLLSLYLDGRPYFSGRRCGTNPPCVDLPVSVGVAQTWTGIPFHRFPGGIERILLESRAFSAEEIAAWVERERPLLDPKATFGLMRKPMTLDEKLPRTAAYERDLPPALPGQPNRVFGRTLVNGQPRLTVDGEPVAALAMMPSPYVAPEEAAKSIADFAAAGVCFYSDIFWSYGPHNDWWLGEGRYDFAALDAKVAAELAVAPRAFYFPRIKLDPPDWWAKAHPEEMQSEHVRPDSAAWNALWPQMLADVVDHFERSPLAGRIMGYQFGALVGSEWIVRAGPPPAWKNALRGDIAPSSASIAPLRDWQALRGSRIEAVVKKAARIVKERTQGKKLTGVFFGYGLPEHACFPDLLASPDIDYFCSPTTYHGRYAGEPGRFSVNVQASCRLHGKLYYDECDLRTHLYHKPSDWRHRDEFESVNALRRAFGWSWAHGHEIWWFCLEGNGMFHSEAMMETIRRGVAMSPVSSSVAFAADVAVFSDTTFSIPNESVQILTRERFERWSLPKSGVAWDQYHIADVVHPNLPNYKVYVFANAYALSAAEREAVKRIVRRKGVTAVFFGAPGYYNGAREGVSEMSDLTGIAFAEHVFKQAAAADVTGCGVQLRLPRVFVPQDAAARSIGTYRGWPVCVEKDVPGGGRVICLPAPPESGLLRDLFRRAGAHVWLESDDTLGVGRDTVMVHAATDGEKTVRLPRKASLRDVFGGAKTGAVDTVVVTMRKGETKVWRLADD